MSNSNLSIRSNRLVQLSMVNIRAAVEATSTRVVVVPPCNVPQRFSCCSLTVSSQMHRSPPALMTFILEQTVSKPGSLNIVDKICLTNFVFGLLIGRHCDNQKKSTATTTRTLRRTHQDHLSCIMPSCM